MAAIFRIELLPARHGDCILIEYGDADSPCRVLIDGGPIGAYGALQARLQRLPASQRQFELLVVTHIDADHIEGAIKLLNHPELGLGFGDIWFNGLPHLELPLLPPLAELTANSRRSVLGGEYLLQRIGGAPSNGHFLNGPIFVPDQGRLPRRTLPGGLVLTLLSPDAAGLETLRKKWHEELAKARIASGSQEVVDKLNRAKALRNAEVSQQAPEHDIVAEALAVKPTLDSAVANRSSIAFLAEYGGRSCAFLADAQMRTLEPAVDRLLRERNVARLQLDALKMPHHGSAGNISVSFLRQVQCRDYLVSTDGSVFGHPDAEAITQVVTRSPGARLVFNYSSEQTRPWADPALQSKYGFSAVYPAGPEGGISIDLLQPTGAP